MPAGGYSRSRQEARIGWKYPHSRAHHRMSSSRCCSPRRCRGPWSSLSLRTGGENFGLCEEGPRILCFLVQPAEHYSVQVKMTSTPHCRMEQTHLGPLSRFAGKRAHRLPEERGVPSDSLTWKWTTPSLILFVYMNM